MYKTELLFPSRSSSISFSSNKELRLAACVMLSIVLLVVSLLDLG